MRRVTWTENGAQLEGWFHKWTTVADSDGQSVHAIVEMDDGIVCTPQVWHGASLRFVTPHKPEVHQEGSNSPDWLQYPELLDDEGDPMEPDYRALANDEPSSQIQDSRDSAGI